MSSIGADFCILMIVLKFGGSALCDASSFLLCAQKIVKTQKPFAIIVSAMHGVTQQLFELSIAGKNGRPEGVIDYHYRILEHLASYEPLFATSLSALEEILKMTHKTIEQNLQTSTCSPQAQAEILAQGEWLSAHIMSHLLRSMGTDTSLLDPRQFIRTRGSPLQAEVLMSETMSKIHSLTEHPHSKLLIPGFFGAHHASNQTALLGANSSDYTGAIFALGLGAFGYEIWKDIDGIYDSDPKLSKNAQMKKYFSYDELIEKSSEFSQVIHPAVAPLLKPLGIPIFIRSIFKPEAPGSIITDKQFSLSS